ncbi:MAG: DUF2335 domain-containing protein, partial [Alphaproteobacteria bacterium]
MARRRQKPPQIKPTGPQNSGRGNARGGHIVSASWQAPMPPPQILDGYKQVVENGAERIMRMAEKAQDADIEVGRAFVADNKRGQLLGGAISIIALVVGGAVGVAGLYFHAPAAFYALPVACDRGRNVHYWTPPAQIRTGGFPAYGSHLGCLTALPCGSSYAAQRMGH